ADAFWQRQAAVTPPGPASPPLSVTLVPRKAMSQAALAFALGVGVTMAESARLTNCQSAVAMTVIEPVSCSSTGEITVSVEQAEIAAAEAIVMRRFSIGYREL